MTIDIDADAAKILACATREVKFILDRRAALDREGKQNLPLVVLAGENHGIPGHVLRHVLDIDGLRKKENIVVGVEQPHNRLDETFQHVTGKKAGGLIYPSLRTLDQRGKHSLQVLLGSLVRSRADHSHVTLYNYLANHDVPTCLTDAAWSKDCVYLDHRDPSTARSMKACFGKAARRINLGSPLGVFIRNHHMADRLLDYASGQQARIAFQMGGGIHGAGYAGKFSWQHSLSALFKGIHIPVVALLPVHKDMSEKDIPAHELTGDELLLIRDLPEHRSEYDGDSGLPFTSAFAEASALHSRETEAIYVKKILQHAGLESETFSIPKLQSCRTNFLREYKPLFESLIPPLAERLKYKLAAAGKACGLAFGG